MRLIPRPKHTKATFDELNEGLENLLQEYLDVDNVCYPGEHIPRQTMEMMEKEKELLIERMALLIEMRDVSPEVAKVALSGFAQPMIMDRVLAVIHKHEREEREKGCIHGFCRMVRKLKEFTSCPPAALIERPNQKVFLKAALEKDPDKRIQKLSKLLGYEL